MDSNEMGNQSSQGTFANQPGGGESNQSATGGEGGAETGNVEFIKLKVKAQDGQEVHFRVKKSTTMGKLIKSYADRVGIQANTLRFLFDGQRITETDTPSTLDMVEDDVIDVYQEQTGGGSNDNC